MVCESWCVQKEGRCRQVPRLPRSGGCHQSATPATQSGASRATNGDQARHQSQPSAISVTPAAQNEGRCRQVLRLPHKTMVDVTNCHTCHAKLSRRQARPKGPKRASSRPSPAQQVPRSMSPSAAPATQKCHAPRATKRPQARHQTQTSSRRATPPMQNQGRCHQAPHLPRKVQVDVTKCQTQPQFQKRHACHAERRSMLPSATPATQNASACRQVPRLRRKTQVDVTKRHACHAKVPRRHARRRGPRRASRLSPVP